MNRISAKETANMLGESYWTFIKKMNRGEYPGIPHMRKGLGKKPHYLFTKEKLEEWIDKQMQRRK